MLLLCNWCDSRTLCYFWNKMSKGNYTWNNIKIVWSEPTDWYVIINSPLYTCTEIPDLKKTILFQMEPFMNSKHKNRWGDWSNPSSKLFKYMATHKTEYNNNEWHLSKTYNELMSEKIIKIKKYDFTLSTVLSDKMLEEGQQKRIRFVKYLEKKGMSLDIYGSNKLNWKNYKGSLPYHAKDNGMFPYKYVFNAENNKIPNYYTEKLIDGILAECLVFYWGCPNVSEYIDSRAYIQLDLSDMKNDYKIIVDAMKNNLWEDRISYIRESKHKILNTLQFFPRLERILSSTN